MRAELADGRILEFPEGTSPEVVHAAVKNVLSGNIQIKQPPTLEQRLKSYGESAVSGLSQFVEGAAQAGAHIGSEGLNQGIEKRLGGAIELTDYTKQRLEEEGLPQPVKEPLVQPMSAEVDKVLQEKQKQKQLGMQQADRGEFDLVELAAMMATGGMKTGTELPKAVDAFGHPVKQALMRRMAEGGLQGATYGGVMPVTSGDYADTKKLQMATGAGVGAAIPPVIAAGGKAGELVDQLTRPSKWRNKPVPVEAMQKGKMGGIQRDVQEYTNELLGDSRKPVIDALTNPTRYPHNKTPTAAQAVAEGNIKSDKRFGNVVAGLEREVARKPESADILNTVYKGQKTGRNKVVDAIAKDDAALKIAEKARTTATKPYYDAVEKSSTRVDAKPVLDKVDDILSKNQNNDSVTVPLNQIRKKLMNGDRVEDQVNALKSLSDDLRNKMNSKNPTTGKNEFDVQSLSSVKKMLDKQIKQDVPEFGVAQKVHAKESIPINQMKVAQALQKKMGEEVGDQSAKPYIKAMEDEAKLVKTSTGFKRGGSSAAKDVFKGDPEAYKGLKNVADDLNRDLEAGRMANEVENVFGGVKKGIEPRIPGMLERNVVIANALLKKIATDKTGAYAKELSRLMANPEEFATLLNAPPNSPLVRNMIETINQLSKAAPIAAAKGEQ